MQYFIGKQLKHDTFLCFNATSCIDDTEFSWVWYVVSCDNLHAISAIRRGVFCIPDITISMLLHHQSWLIVDGYNQFEIGYCDISFMVACRHEIWRRIGDFLWWHFFLIVWCVSKINNKLFIVFCNVSGSNEWTTQVLWWRLGEMKWKNIMGIFQIRM